MIVDCHTHLLPPRLARRVRGFFERHRMSDRLAYSLEYEALLDRHAADQIAAVWNLPYAHKGGMARRLNASMLEVAERFAGHDVAIVTGCTVHPDDPAPEEDLRLAVAEGARVLKLHCSVGDYELIDPRLDPVLEAAGELAVPVTVHAGHAVSGHTAAHELEPIAQAVAAHPRTRFVLAHCGHDASAEALDLLGRFTNLWADLTPVIQEPVPLTASAATEFAARLLFGSDAPNTGQPAGQLLDHLRSLDLEPAVLDRITGGNAVRLIRR